MALPIGWIYKKAPPPERPAYHCECGGYKERLDGVHWSCTNRHHEADLKQKQAEAKKKQARDQLVEEIKMHALRHCRA